MARVYYERLSDECADYLENESSRRREHTTMILIFDSGPFATKEGGVDFEKIREIVNARLPELPRLRAKLRRVPLDGHPVWVDDQEFNLDFHLRQSSLPRPGSHEQLCRTASRIAATRLDRSRPLWDCWVLEGLEGGRFAMILKMHKALAHLEGADLLQTLLSADADAPLPKATRALVRPAPSPVELFGEEVLRRWSPSRRAVGRAMRFWESPARASRLVQKRAQNVLRALGYQIRPAGESPFDGNLSPHRSYAVQEVDLDQVQTIRQIIGGTVHDAVLTILTGALRRFVEGLKISPTTVDLRAVTPILDATGETAEAWVIELPVWEASGEVRQELLGEQTRRIRSEQDLASAESLASGDTWTAARLFAIGARALKRIENGQLAVLQSPGPQQPLYLNGAKLEECYGILPLQDASGLGVTVMSYAGSLFFSFNCDPDIVPDVGLLRDGVEAEVASLLSSAKSRGPALRAVGGQG